MSRPRRSTSARRDTTTFVRGHSTASSPRDSPRNLGVTAVGYARVLPLSMNTTGVDIAIDGYAPPGGRAGGEFPVLLDEIDEGYLTVTRMPVVAGRDIRATDDSTSPRVAIVNQTFAARFWRGRESDRPDLSLQHQHRDGRRCCARLEVRATQRCARALYVPADRAALELRHEPARPHRR